MWCVSVYVRVCVCGLWSSCASHIVQMWCNKTQCEKSAHIWKGAENMRDVTPEQDAHGKDHRSRPRACCTEYFPVVCLEFVGSKLRKVRFG